jgi:hypothetical protein
MSAARPPQFAWPLVLCVVGLDYLSSVAYQPSVAVAAAGRLAPVATVALVLVTLVLAVPVYAYVAGRSPNGAGSTGLLERLLPGWFGKLLVLTLLGFAATDLIFTRTFSAADAAEHLLHSPSSPWQATLAELTHAGDRVRAELPADLRAVVGEDQRRTAITVLLLTVGSAVGFGCRRGVTRGLVRVAVVAVAVYAALAAAVVGAGLLDLARDPARLADWWAAVRADGGRPLPGLGVWAGLAVLSLAAFPKLALGLSGFELTLTTMPLVRGADAAARVRGTRLMLVAAAAVMSAYLLGSTLVVTVLVSPHAIAADGLAANRPLSYLANGGDLADGRTAAALCPLFGPAFGAAYDLAAVTVLTLAGVSVLIGLRELIPPYLHRLGMDFDWSRRVGGLVYLFTLLKLAVTVYYRADPDAQRGAYLTGVLAVFLFAAVAAAVDVYQRRRTRGRRRVFALSPLFLLAAGVFAVSLAAVVRGQPAGAVLAGWFVGLTLLASMVVRFFRTTELRHDGFEFADDASARAWADLKANDYPILVPLRPGGEGVVAKEEQLRKRHRLPPTLPVVFFQVDLGDASEFSHRPLVRVAREDGRVVVHITRCASIPHAVAAAALEIAEAGVRPEVHFGWSAEHPLTANLNFVLFGQGNVPWMVYELIRRSPAPDDRKPWVMVA